MFGLPRLAPAPNGFCRADVDDGSGTGSPDGGVDVNDFLFFFTVWEAGNLAADLDDGSGLGIPDDGVDANDLLYFLTAFEEGTRGGGPASLSCPTHDESLGSRIGLDAGRAGGRGAAPTAGTASVAANAAGGRYFSDECGRWWLYSCRHEAASVLASRTSANTSALSSSSRSREWKLSAYPFSHGAPGAMYRFFIPVSSATPSACTTPAMGRRRLHRVRLTQLPHDLFRCVPRPLHLREPPGPRRGPSRLSWAWIRLRGAGQLRVRLPQLVDHLFRRMTLPAHGRDPPDPARSVKLQLDCVQGERSMHPRHA